MGKTEPAPDRAILEISPENPEFTAIVDKFAGEHGINVEYINTAAEARRERFEEIDRLHEEGGKHLAAAEAILQRLAPRPA